jgi:hypothetical protein
MGVTVKGIRQPDVVAAWSDFVRRVHPDVGDEEIEQYPTPAVAVMSVNLPPSALWKR